MNLITDYPVHYSPEEYKRLKARNRNYALRSQTQLSEGPFESFAEALNPTPSYPFCDTATCPWWRGYCSRDPSCDN